ncbi:DUF4810 domain-containing protein [Trabulsiella odontotermitis]|uniref:DUF4810 domain-containing protein n=1 Tax=Trabulsiella odontotermitis TaxID=379893 RepID=UPI0024B71AA7|nr:DUF4810 domain-containing protein [Trabulsiella odontotermitis]WHP33448.1 DUF4810 domain-containing protein [Trabulsiella odontotermitis]
MAYLNRIAAGAAVLLLAGCANHAPQKLYTWDGYEDSVYHYYTNESSAQEQIASLQKLIEMSRSSNKPVPPGVHAQLGMLYSNTGNADLAMAEFNAEKTQYPESASYINFLTAKK